MRILDIFLASSAELSDERKNFERFMNRINNEWVRRETYFRLTIWEDFIDAMSKTRLQDEYNKAIKSSDIFIMLFFTKVGIYTNEEFELAFGSFKENNKPLIYTYFKDDLILTGDINHDIISMLDFKKKISDLGHYCSRYKSIEDLQWQFGRQLEKLYGEISLSSYEINLNTPQSQIDSIALSMTNKLLSQNSTEIDGEKFKEVISKTSDLTRHTIFLLAQQTRSDSWENNVGLMEKTIPIFEALIESDKRQEKHYYFGQLGYALKDKGAPDYQRALDCFNSAIDLRGSANENGWFLYEFNRAICIVSLDERFSKNEISIEKTKRAIVNDLAIVKRGYGDDFYNIVKQPLNRKLAKWIQLNKVKI
jgi:hypothetical protein